MLSSRVLVLNKTWTAINVATVRRAICLVYQGLARVVDTETYGTYDFEDWIISSSDAAGGVIRGVAFQLRIPEVIVLTAFNGLHMREIKFSRRNVFERDEYTCQYCGRRFERSQFTLDHVTPRSRGGITSWENVLLACAQCNTRKGDRLPGEAGMQPFRRPTRPSWALFIGTRLSQIQRRSWRKFLYNGNGNGNGLRSC